MQFSQDQDVASYTIRAYAVGKIDIVAPAGGMSSGSQPRAQQPYVMTSSFIMTATCLIDDWPPQSVKQLSDDNLKLIVALAPEMILLGTGNTLQFPASHLTVELMAQGIGVEIMTTPAACRTYNILVNENRNVALAILL
ncbi:MAG: hypothetical protein GXP08_10505 [Gammaproteobacteria bacterium]|nr:hypothetical protein [Gammaproteobacteria bacterium]